MIFNDSMHSTLDISHAVTQNTIVSIGITCCHRHATGPMQDIQEDDERITVVYEDALCRAAPPAVRGITVVRLALMYRHGRIPACR